MIKKNLFTSILVLCAEYKITAKEYKKWDVVIDHESNHNLYIFASGWYSVWSGNAFWGIHEVGEIEAPSVLWEGIFYGSFHKEVKVVCEEPGLIYTLTEKDIAHINRENPTFMEVLMRSCLAVTNERIIEANTERSISYSLMDALEHHSFGSIPTLLTILKDTFSLQDAIWIERHEVLHDIFSLRYRESHGNLPVNERITLPQGSSESPYTLPEFLGEWQAHIFPLTSGHECFGYLIYISPKKRLPGYIARITVDMIPNCIRIIESGWKKN